jgi:hypothetical protein
MAVLVRNDETAPIDAKSGMAMPKTKFARKLTIGTAPSSGNHKLI